MLYRLDFVEPSDTRKGSSFMPINVVNLYSNWECCLGYDVRGKKYHNITVNFRKKIKIIEIKLAKMNSIEIVFNDTDRNDGDGSQDSNNYGTDWKIVIP